MGIDDAPEFSETPETKAEPPTEDEDMGLVAKMRAARQERVFYLPDGRNPDGSVRFSDTYFVKLRTWTGSQRDQYLSAGQKYGLEVPRGRRQTKSKQRVHSRFDMDMVEQLRVLVNLSVVDFKLIHDGRDVTFRESGANWSVFRDLSPDVMDWVRDTIREFQGIEMEDEDEGEA